MPRRIVIVGRRAWHPRLRRDFEPLDGRQKNAAAAILRYLHDLHIGVTPELAAGLARLLDADTRRRSASLRTDSLQTDSLSTDTGAWRQIFERLEDQIVPPRPDGGSRPKSKRQRFTGLVPASATFYTLARIAAPVLTRASEKLDRVYLFAADLEPCPENFEQDYTRYSAELAHQVRRLASSSEVSDVFWADRAFSLHHLSGSGKSTGIPDVDAVALGQLLRLEPQLADLPRTRRSLPRKLTTSPRYKPLLNRNEGGVDGIFQTRRLADLPAILKSEFIHPPPLLFERLLQSGYLALRRPPLREKQRDVMVASVLPPAPVGSSAAMRNGWIKAAWFDAVSRLSLWFSRAGLRRSEFLWTEADECDRYRASRFLLDDLPETFQHLEKPTPVYRRELLMALGWLPEFLDQHGSGRWPATSPTSPTSPISTTKDTVEIAPDLFDWSTAAWHGQREQWQAYDTLHLMLFLPRRVEKLRPFGGLRHAFGLPAESGYSVSVTWVPETFTDLEAETGWAFSAERKPLRSFAFREDASGAHLENQLAGMLISAWLQTILEELVRDD